MGSVAATVQRRQEPRIGRAFEGALRALVAREPLAKLDWYCAAWERETGMVVSIQTMSRMLVRLGLRQKTTVGARERDEVARSDWRERAQTLPARRVVVIHESSTHLDMARRYGRAPRGERVYVKQRRNYGQDVTLLAGLRLDGMTDSMVIEGPERAQNRALEARTPQSERAALELAVCMDALQKLARLWDAGEPEEREGMARTFFSHIAFDLDARRIVDFRLEAFGRTTSGPQSSTLRHREQRCLSELQQCNTVRDGVLIPHRPKSPLH